MPNPNIMTLIQVAGTLTAVTGGYMMYKRMKQPEVYRSSQL